MFNDSVFPKNWEGGIIVPIFKGGNIDDAKNYRGITLNNILAKIYSKLLYIRLSKWTEKHKIIIDSERKIYS